MKRNGRRLATALTLTLVVATAACGGSDDNKSAATETTKATTATTVAGADDSTAATLTALESEPGVKELVSIAEKSETYVGKVDGPPDSDAYIAIVDNGAGDITAYVCDGKTIGAWAAGTRTGDEVTASGKSGLKVDGTISGASVSGTADVPSWGPHAFTASLAKHPAGLWQPYDTETGEFAGLKVGWIVLDDGSQRGLALTSQKKLNIVEPVNTVSGPAGSSTPGPVTTDGLTSECQHLQNLYLRGWRTFVTAAEGSAIQTSANNLIKQVDGLWDSQGCPGNPKSVG